MLCVFDVKIGDHYNISVVDVPQSFTEILDLLTTVEDQEDAEAFVILDLHNDNRVVYQQFKTTEEAMGKLIRPRDAMIFRYRDQWFHEDVAIDIILKKLNKR